MPVATNNLTRKDRAVKAVEPINLRERFGRRYKVGYDEAFFAEHGPNARGDDPWLLIIVGRLGHVYPLGGELLAVVTNACGSTANRLARLQFCKVMLDGDDGITLAFHVNYFRQITKIIRAHTTRTLTSMQQAALIKAGTNCRFKRITGSTSGAAHNRE